MKLLVTLSLLLSTAILQAQNGFLTIFPEDDLTTQVMFPPGTPFELKTKEGEIVFTDKSELGTFKIEGDHVLTVYPTWKNTTDVFQLTTGGRLELRPPLRMSSYNKDKDKHKDSGWGSFSNGVTVEKILSPSEKFEGKQNVELRFSNGVVFTYKDGTYYAKLNGESLEIKSKYLIYSDLGIHKVSFNPSNGKVYWVFEPQS